MISTTPRHMLWHTENEGEIWLVSSKSALVCDGPDVAGAEDSGTQTAVTIQEHRNALLRAPGSAETDWRAQLVPLCR